MKYVDFRKFTDEHGAQPIYLLEGEELYFREKGEALLRSRYVQEPILDSAVLDGGLLKGDKITQLLAAVNTFPFVSEKRFVKVTEFYPTQNDFEKYLQPYFENPTSSTILFIANSEKGKAPCPYPRRKTSRTWIAENRTRKRLNAGSISQ